MLAIQEISIEGYEKVIEGIDSQAGLHCFIAIHNTVLGPAIGGTRMYPYSSREEALQDGLRLAKAMTYKSAIAGNSLGGGKGVIIGDPKTAKTPALWKAYAEVLNSLSGRYITAEDVGTTTDDMGAIHANSNYVAALSNEKSSGDPSRFTAWGVFQGMKAVAQKVWKHPSLARKLIAIQGTGSVGSKLADFLFWEGADLILCDVDPSKVHPYTTRYGAQLIPFQDFFNVKCDILSPCALGGILNDNTIPSLRCSAIAGSANNQLLEARHGMSLMERGILYAPDYVINAGGIINAAAEFTPQGYNPKLAREKVNQISDTLQQIFEQSEKTKKPTNIIADEIAEKKLR